MIVDLETFLTLETFGSGKCLHIGYCLDMTMCCHCCQFSTLLGTLDGEEGRWRGMILLLHTWVFWFPLLLSFFLQTAPHVTTLLQIYSDLCAHQNLQKRPIQLKFKMSQHHSEKTSVDQTDSRKQRKNFAW